MTKVQLQSKEELECRQFFLWREENPEGTMEQAAAHLGISRASLYIHMNKWKEKGLYEKIELEIMLPKQFALDNAINQIVTGFPAVLQLILAEAMDGNTKPQERRAHAKFLAEHVVNPYYERLGKKGEEEKEYMDSEPDFNPTDIPLLNGTNSGAIKTDFESFMTSEDED